MVVARTLVLFGCWLLFSSCAEGLPGPNGFSELQLGSTPGRAPIIDSGPPPMTPMTNEKPAFMGMPCERNTMMACPCMDDTGAMGMGTQRCLYDPMSPTMGAIGPCERCVVPMPEAPPDAGAAGGMAAGSGGAGGSMSAGSGGSAAGAGGSAGSAGSGDMEPECDPDDCPAPGGLFGGLREKCCTRRGECGSQGLLGGCEEN